MKEIQFLKSNKKENLYHEINFNLKIVQKRNHVMRIHINSKFQGYAKSYTNDKIWLLKQKRSNQVWILIFNAEGIKLKIYNVGVEYGLSVFQDILNKSA